MPENPKVIKSIVYVSPYAALPPDAWTAGITVQADPEQAPPHIADPVFVIRLRLSTSPTAIGTSATSGIAAKSFALYQPPFPLSAAEPYMVDATWVERGTPANEIPWSSALASAPVTAAAAAVTWARFDGTTFTASVAIGASGIGVGAQVTVYGLSAGVSVFVGQSQSQGSLVTVPVESHHPPPFQVFAQAATPANNPGGKGSFAAPFSLGPMSTPAVVPQAIKSITAAAYDGKYLTLKWDLDTVAGCPSPESSLIEILDAAGLAVMSASGGPKSATVAIKLDELPGFKVQVRSVANAVQSKPVTHDLVTLAPAVSAVTFDSAGRKVDATVTLPANSGSLAGRAWLMDGDQVVSGPTTVANGAVSFAYDAAGRVGLGVVAQATAANGATGPKSAPVPLLATAPTLTRADIHIYSDPADAIKKWRVELQWEPLPDPPAFVTSYTAKIVSPDSNEPVATATSTGTSATLSFLKSKITDYTKAQTIVLQAKSLANGGSPIARVPAPFDAPKLTSVTTSSDQISAVWTAPAAVGSPHIPPTYRISIRDHDDKTLYLGPPRTAVEGAVALAELALASASKVSLLVDMSLGPVHLRADATMGPKHSADPILTAPKVAAVTVDPTTNKPTLQWSAGPSGTTYVLDFTKGASPGDLNTNSYTFTSDLAVGEVLGFAVKMRAPANQVTVTGPPSAQVLVPSQAARANQVRYDGTTVRVDWTPLADAHSYEVSVYDNSDPPNEPHSHSTTQSSLTFPFSAVAGKSYSVYVQPVLASGAGLAGPAKPLFSSALFPSHQPASTAVPYLYPATKMATLGSKDSGPTAEALTFYLPELGSAAGALGTKPISNGPFTIEPTSNNSALPYKLTIAAAAAAWSFTTQAIRAPLKDAYVAFLKALETPPVGEEIANSAPTQAAVTGATPYGISLVQAVIGRFLPQTFTESLYYNFGLSAASASGGGSVDLRPGMVLRVVAGDYVSINQLNLPSWLNGYAGAGFMDFDISSYASHDAWRTGFNGFLNALSAQGVLQADSPASGTGSAQAGVASPADLYFPQFLQPFYRLFIPAKIQSATSVGSNATSANFTIAAAASFSALEATTTDPTHNPTAYFRGRTTLEVLIRVTLNGQERLVPVGTAVGNLLEQAGGRAASSSPGLENLRLYRPIQPAVTALTAADSLGPDLEVRFDWKGLPVYSDGQGLDALSMPLLAGDRIFTAAGEKGS